MRVAHGHGRAGNGFDGLAVFIQAGFTPGLEFFGGLALEEFLIGIHLFKPFACAAHAIFIAALALGAPDGNQLVGHIGGDFHRFDFLGLQIIPIHRLADDRITRAGSHGDGRVGDFQHVDVAVHNAAFSIKLHESESCIVKRGTASVETEGEGGADAFVNGFGIRRDGDGQAQSQQGRQDERDKFFVHGEILPPNESANWN